MSHSFAISKTSRCTETKTLTQYRSPEQLIVYAVISKNKFICYIIHILNQRAQHLLV
jgi:hypothetical protein